MRVLMCLLLLVQECSSLGVHSQTQALEYLGAKIRLGLRRGPRGASYPSFRKPKVMHVHRLEAYVYS